VNKEKERKKMSSDGAPAVVISVPAAIRESQVKSCAQVALLDDSYFADLTWKADSPIAAAGNTLIVVGETISLVLAIPFVLAGSLFAGMLKGFMPLVVLWVSLFRMFLRPGLAVVSDFYWAMTHNYTVRASYKKVDAFDVSPVAAVVAARAPAPRGGYEAV
jgi:hypothetical protein